MPTPSAALGCTVVLYVVDIEDGVVEICSFGAILALAEILACWLTIAILSKG